jgi:hypothetical protein
MVLRTGPPEVPKAPHPKCCESLGCLKDGLGVRGPCLEYLGEDTPPHLAWQAVVSTMGSLCWSTEWLPSSATSSTCGKLFLPGRVCFMLSLSGPWGHHVHKSSYGQVTACGGWLEGSFPSQLSGWQQGEAHSSGSLPGGKQKELLELVKLSSVM